jgi:hypothetical protein
MNEIKYKQESFIQFEYFNFYVLFKILFQYFNWFYIVVAI